MAKQDKHKVSGTYVRETERGVCLNIDGNEVWMPKSQLTRVEPVGVVEFVEGDQVVVQAPEWLLEEKEVNYG